MDSINEILANIAAAAPALVPILYTLLIAAGLDLLTGSWAAYSSGTFKWEFVAEFVRSHIALKIGPIVLSLVAGVAVGGTDTVAGAALLAAGGASAAAYLAAVLASIKGNLDAQSAKDKGLPTGVQPSSGVLVSEATIGETLPPA